MMTLSRTAAILLRLGAIVLAVTPPGSSLVSAFPLTPCRVTGNAIASLRCDDHGVDGHGRRRCPTLLLTRPPSWSSSSSSSSLSLLPPSLSSSSLEKTIHGSGTAMFLAEESDTEDATDIPTLDQQQATINATVKVENSGGIVPQGLKEWWEDFQRWLRRRSGIIFSAGVAAAFSWYGVYGSIGILPFLPPMEKATTLEDWRNIYSICAFFFAFPAAFMSVDMQDDAIILQANIRTEDRELAAKSKVVERELAAAIRKEDLDLAANKTKLEAAFREVDLKMAVNKTELEVGFRKEDRVDRLEERAREDKRRHEDRKEKLEDRIIALHRERNQPFVLPWDKKAIDDEIQLANERLEKLRRNEA